MNDPPLFTAVFALVEALIGALDGLWLQLWHYRLHIHAPAPHTPEDSRTRLTDPSGNGAGDILPDDAGLAQTLLDALPAGVPMRVADLMTADVAECSPEESIRAAAKRMVDHHCGCLPVTVCDGDQRRLVGIVTDRDLACRAVAAGLDPERTDVARCMSFPVQTITRDADLSECADRFITIRLRRLVVVDDQNRCLGVISRSDLQRFVTDTATTQGGEQPPTAPAKPSGTATDAANGFALAPSNHPDRGNPELTL